MVHLVAHTVLVAVHPGFDVLQIQLALERHGVDGLAAELNGHFLLLIVLVVLVVYSLFYAMLVLHVLRKLTCFPLTTSQFTEKVVSMGSSRISLLSTSETAMMGSSILTFCSFPFVDTTRSIDPLLCPSNFYTEQLYRFPHPCCSCASLFPNHSPLTCLVCSETCTAFLPAVEPTTDTVTCKRTRIFCSTSIMIWILALTSMAIEPLLP